MFWWLVCKLWVAQIFFWYLKKGKFIYLTTSFSSLIWEKMNCQISGIHSHLMEEKIEEMDQEQENQDQAVTDNQEILITSSGTHVDYTEIHIILVKFAAVWKVGGVCFMLIEWHCKCRLGDDSERFIFPGVTNWWNRWSIKIDINWWQSMPINQLILIIDDQSMMKIFVTLSIGIDCCRLLSIVIDCYWLLSIVIYYHNAVFVLSKLS